MGQLHAVDKSTKLSGPAYDCCVIKEERNVRARGKIMRDKTGERREERHKYEFLELRKESERVRERERERQIGTSVDSLHCVL